MDDGGGGGKEGNEDEESVALGGHFTCQAQDFMRH
jgi:hypothetical protein